MSVDSTSQQAIQGLDFAPSPIRSNSQSSDELKQDYDVSDKLEQTGAVSPSSDTSGNNDEIVFTEAEDRAVRRKLDLIVMPILFLGFYVFQVSSCPVSSYLTMDSGLVSTRQQSRMLIFNSIRSSNEVTSPTP